MNPKAHLQPLKPGHTRTRRVPRQPSGLDSPLRALQLASSPPRSVRLLVSLRFIRYLTLSSSLVCTARHPSSTRLSAGARPPPAFARPLAPGHQPTGRPTGPTSARSRASRRRPTPLVTSRRPSAGRRSPRRGRRPFARSRTGCGASTSTRSAGRASGMSSATST